MPNIFGLPTPEEIQQAQFARNIQLLSQARPGQAPAAVAGQNLGNAIGSAFGIENPQIARARLMEEAQAEVRASGVQPGKEGYLEAVTQSLMNRGLGAEAQQAQATYAKFQEQILKTEKLNQEVTSVRQRNEALAARGPYAQMFSLLQEGATADKKNALNIANSTDAAGILANSGIESNLYASFLEGVANDVQATIATNVSTTGGTSREDLDAGTTITGTTRSARISRGQLNSIVSKNLSELGIDINRLQPRALQGVSLNSPVQLPPAAQPQRSSAISRATNRPVPQSHVLTTQEQPRQETQAAPNIRGRTRPQSETQAGRRLKGGDGRVFSIEDVARAQKNGFVEFTRATSNEGKKRNGLLPQNVAADQKDAKLKLNQVQRIVGIVNDIGGLIEERGQAFPTVWGSILRDISQELRGSGGDIVGSATRVLSSLLQKLDIQDPKERETIRRILVKVEQGRLIEKDLQNLGALTGSDYQIVSNIFRSPTEYSNRVNGIRAWFEGASDYMDNVYDEIGDLTERASLKSFRVKSPSSILRLSSHLNDQDVQAIISSVETGRATPANGAKALTNLLGFQVSPVHVSIMAAQGGFERRGGTGRALLNTGEGAIEGAAQIGGQLIEEAGNVLPQFPPQIQPGAQPLQPRPQSIDFIQRIIQRELSQ